MFVHEPARTGDFLLQEADGYYSRDAATFLAGNGADVVIRAGEVCGRILFADAVVTPGGGNTGDGTISGAAFGLATVVGTYRLDCTAASADGGTFAVTAPDGTRLGDAAVGTAYQNDHLAFTIDDGAADFAVGDSFTVQANAGSEKAVPLDPAATDGSQRVAGIAFTRYVVPDGADLGGALVARDAAVKRAGLIWPDGITAEEKSSAIAQLEARGILIRDSA